LRKETLGKMILKLSLCTSSSLEPSLSLRPLSANVDKLEGDTLDVDVKLNDALEKKWSEMTRQKTA
jgi:hypothetical protein